MRNNKKIIIAIVIVLVIIIVVSSVTYAIFRWRSTYGLNVNIEVTDHIIITFDGGTNITDKLKPVEGPTDGLIKHMSIRSNLPSSSDTYGIYLKINDLPNALKNEEFNWMLIDCDLINDDHCALEYTEVNAHGNFSTTSMNEFTDSETGDLLLFEGDSIPFKNKQDLYLYLWINGTVDNDLSMSGKSIDFDIYAKGFTTDNGEVSEVEHD